VRLIGIDLAAAPVRTGVCVLDNGVVLHIGVGSTNCGHPSWLVDHCIGANVVAIDVPFGWPKPFTEGLAEYRIGYRLGSPRHRYQLRATDLWIRDKFPPLRPISVSTDKLGTTAIVGTNLLHALSGEFKLAPTSSGVDRSVIEVYPAASLQAWHLPYKGYKTGPIATKVRQEILDGLQHKLGFDPAGYRADLAGSDHCLDALIAALTAWQYAEGTVSAPENFRREVLETEGWIWAPTLGTMPEVLPS